jgi:glycine oxidase
MRSADAVVVGGGLIGCAIARELARRGVRTALVERGVVGAEATRAAAGMVAPQAECERRGPVLSLGLASRARYAAWIAAVEAESGIDVEYATDGIVYAVLDDADARTLAARARWQRAAGLRVERLRATDARRLVPALSPRARWALHFPDDHRVNNERLGPAVGVAARRAGVRVLEGVTALRVRARRRRLAGLETSAGTIPSPAVVNAAGAWAGFLALPAGVAPPPVFPVRGQMLVLRGEPRALRRPLYSRRGYLVPRRDGRILAGSTLERAGFDKRVTAGAAAEILAALRALAPGLGALTLEGAYAGLRPGTPDRRPILGAAPGLEGLYYATGHYRSGILLAPATAVAIADLVLEGRTALPLAGMAPARFVRAGRRRHRCATSS